MFYHRVSHHMPDDPIQLTKSIRQACKFHKYHSLFNVQQRHPIDVIWTYLCSVGIILIL